MKSLINIIRCYKEGKRILTDPLHKECLEAGKQVLNNTFHIDAYNKNLLEQTKEPGRTKVINYLITFLDRETSYLEIGVRDPNDNFHQILANKKYSVDPGYEFEVNPVDFKMTSDSFFDKLRTNQILSNKIKFDVIFIDGLHLAEQVDLDIRNSVGFIKDDGFIVLHDCNPPTEWHARQEYQYDISPAKGKWNGTVWKAFIQWRLNPKINSCCIDTDWGVGVLSKTHLIGKKLNKENPFYEFTNLDKNRVEQLNLMSFEEFQKVLSKR